MKAIALSLAAALAALVPTAALACAEHEGTKAEVKKISVPELASLREAKQAQPIDANRTETRAKLGIIPGALLLTSVASFDVAKELPSSKDAKLVFYCANTRCTASLTAAKRAIEAGYTDVSVLPDGIKGWKEAGQRTETPRS